MDEPTFRLVTKQEIGSYLRDMVKGGGFAAFIVDRATPTPRIRIRMNLRDLGNEVRRKVTVAAVISTLADHGSPGAAVTVGFLPLWPVGK